MSGPRILPLGDAAILVELATTTGVAEARAARAFAAAVEALRAHDARLGVPVPGAASVLVPFEPRELTGGDVADLVAPLLDRMSSEPSPGPHPDGAEHVIRVRYGGADGPDLDAVAAELGIAPADLVERHAATRYEVLFLGFAPGFAYLGDLPDALRVPRLATPRTRVPAGSVAIAGAMTAVYPQAAPGGWRLIGRTDATLFDPRADPPARLRPGDPVRFEPA